MHRHFSDTMGKCWEGVILITLSFKLEEIGNSVILFSEDINLNEKVLARFEKNTVWYFSRDYDYWANYTRDESWKYANMLKYFKMSETYGGDFPSGSKNSKYYTSPF